MILEIIAISILCISPMEEQKSIRIWGKETPVNITDLAT